MQAVSELEDSSLHDVVMVKWMLDNCEDFDEIIERIQGMCDWLKSWRNKSGCPNVDRRLFGRQEYLRMQQFNCSLHQVHILFVCMCCAENIQHFERLQDEGWMLKWPGNKASCLQEYALTTYGNGCKRIGTPFLEPQQLDAAQPAMCTKIYALFVAIYSSK
eukprot:scaffold666_cov17-Tisochrysis_lutea.AAC.1